MANAFNGARKAITSSAAKSVESQAAASKSKAIKSKAVNFKAVNSKVVKPKAIKFKVKEKAVSDVASKVPFSKKDLENVHFWLESKANFEVVCGTSGKTSIGRGMRMP